MRDRRTSFELLLSLLQGASWALVILGSVTFFSFFSSFGFLIALISAFIGSLGGLFFVVVFEIAQIQSEKLREIKKQTTVLEEISKKLD